MPTSTQSGALRRPTVVTAGRDLWTPYHEDSTTKAWTSHFRRQQCKHLACQMIPCAVFLRAANTSGGGEQAPGTPKLAQLHRQ